MSWRNATATTDNAARRSIWLSELIPANRARSNSATACRRSDSSRRTALTRATVASARSIIAARSCATMLRSCSSSPSPVPVSRRALTFTTPSTRLPHRRGTTRASSMLGSTPMNRASSTRPVNTSGSPCLATQPEIPSPTRRRALRTICSFAPNAERTTSSSSSWSSMTETPNALNSCPIRSAATAIILSGSSACAISRRTSSRTRTRRASLAAARVDSHSECVSSRSTATSAAERVNSGRLSGSHGRSTRRATIDPTTRSFQMRGTVKRPGARRPSASRIGRGRAAMSLTRPESARL